MTSAIPDVSVVIPCYNAAKTLRAAVDSIGVDCSAEVIIVDDGSTDESLATAAELARDHPNRVIAIAQANAGQAAARNIGLRVARGRYICFLDADDEHIPGFVPLAMKMLDADTSLVGVEGTMLPVDAPSNLLPWHVQIMEGTMLGTVILRTDIVRRVGGFPIDRAFRGEAAGEDGTFRHEVARFGAIAKLQQPFLKYRLGNSSHVRLFLERARLDNGRLTFSRYTPEETDGSMQRAIAAYRRDIAERMLAKVTADIRSELPAIGAYAQVEGSEPPQNAEFHHLLFRIASTWPAMGDVVAINLASDSQRFVEAGCKASGRGAPKLGNSPGMRVRVLIVGDADAETVDPWLQCVSRDGLVVLPTNRHNLTQFSEREWIQELTVGAHIVVRRRATPLTP